MASPAVRLSARAGTPPADRPWHGAASEYFLG
jgi:hypothetical protein